MCGVSRGTRGNENAPALKGRTGLAVLVVSAAWLFRDCGGHAASEHNRLAKAVGTGETYTISEAIVLE